MAVLTERIIEHPFSEQKIRQLKLGELVRLSGHVYAMRDRVHRQLSEAASAPVSLQDGAIYHCGPVAVQEAGKWMIRSAGPTTSCRQEPFMARLIEQYGIRVIIGKGGMGEKTREACARFGCVYLQAVGGAGQMLAARIERVEAVHFLEFGPAEALWDMVMKDFPAVVAIDAHGRSLFQRVEIFSRKAARQLMRGTPAKSGKGV